MNRALLLTMILIGAACSKPEKKEQPVVSREVNELPHLAYNALDGTPTTTRDLPGGSIIILFNTDCDHCQREAKVIQENLSAFTNYTLLFIASETAETIQKFAQEYQLVNQPNIRFGRAESVDVYLNFGSIPTPAIYIYSKERKLVKSFLGETPIDQILSYL
jgi:thiol-disulfide isomerase/thioredoxin